MDKSLKSWIWDAECDIRGAKDAGKLKDFTLPLILVKRLCAVFDDEVNRIAGKVGSRFSYSSLYYGRIAALPTTLHRLVHQATPVQRYFDKCARGTGIRMIPMNCLAVALQDLATRRGISEITALALREQELEGVFRNIDFNSESN